MGLATCLFVVLGSRCGRTSIGICGMCGEAVCLEHADRQFHFHVRLHGGGCRCCAPKKETA